MKRVFAVLFFTIFLFSGLAEAAVPLSSILSRYSEAEDMRLTFTQTLVHQASGARDTQRGFLHFKKPMLVYWEITDPAPEMLIVTGDAIWSVFPDEELAQKYSLELANDSANLIRVITGLDTLEKDFTVEEDAEEAAEETGLRVVRLYPVNPTQSLTEAVLWLDEKERRVKRLRIYDFYGNQNELAFEKEEANLHPSDSLFTFTPPAGFTVEDRSAQGTVETPLNR